MGTYADSLLTDGETVILRQRQHWLALLLDSRVAIALWLVALVLLVVVWLLHIGGSAATVLESLAGITILGGLAVLAFRWWKWRTEEYLITNRRLLKVSGIVNKRSADSNLEKIFNDAILEENLVGRMLDYGDLDILTAAEVAVDRYRMLNHAKLFKKQMLYAKHALEDGGNYRDVGGPPLRAGSGAPGPAQAMAAPVAAGPVVAVPAQPAAAPIATPVARPAAPATERADTPAEVTASVARLAELRDSGAITAEEYEAKKQELLGRL